MILVGVILVGGSLQDRGIMWRKLLGRFFYSPCQYCRGGLCHAPNLTRGRLRRSHESEILGSLHMDMPMSNNTHSLRTLLCWMFPGLLMSRKKRRVTLLGAFPTLNNLQT